MKSSLKYPFLTGSKESVGEFFNPGQSCSHILDKLYEAKDGFYWITLKRSQPIKVRIYLIYQMGHNFACSIVLLGTLLVG